MLQQTSSSQLWLGPLQADRKPRVVILVVLVVLVLLVLVEVRLAVVVRELDVVVAEQCARP